MMYAVPAIPPPACVVQAYIADNPITAHVSQRLLQANAGGLRKGWYGSDAPGKQRSMGHIGQEPHVDKKDADLRLHK